MTKFATFDADGLPTGFYAPEVHGPRTIPVYGDAPEPTEDDPCPAAPIIGHEPNPDCRIPADAIEITDDQWMEFVSHQGQRKWLDGEVVEYVPPPPILTIDDFSAAIRDHLDATARIRQYDDIRTAISYRDDPNPQFAAEGQALFAWRSAVWTYAEAELAKVHAGEREIPTIEEFIAELPPMVWPLEA